MECSEPGAIRDEELLAYIAGEPVRPAVLRHLATCQACSARLAEYRQMELTITSKLYRWDCPPTQLLGEYQLGLLSTDMVAAIRLHLSTCVHCAAEVATLEEFLAPDVVLERAPAAAATSARNNHRPVQEAKVALDRLIGASSSGVRRIIATLLPPQPRLAFQRGVANKLWPRSYAAEDFNISIQVERGASRGDALQLIGFVTRQGTTLEALQGIPVQLSSSANTVYTQSVDELGNFVFTSLLPATYTLELQLPESTIVIDALPVALQD